MSEVSVILRGGLGNNLFQYAAGLYLAERLKVGVVLDARQVRLGVTDHGFALSEFQVAPNVEIIPPISPLWRGNGESLANRFLRFSVRARGGRKCTPQFIPANNGYDPQLDRISEPVTLDGNFQTWRYFNRWSRNNPHTRFILPNFSERTVTVENNKARPGMVAIHVRGGDYAKHGYDLLGEPYYERALHLLGISHREAVIHVFTDDVARAEKALGRHWTRVVGVYSGSGPLNAAWQLVFMSSFPKIVIANSSFGWWSAALSSHTTSVVAPSPWASRFVPTDLLPRHWLQAPAMWSG